MSADVGAPEKRVRSSSGGVSEHDTHPAIASDAAKETDEDILKWVKEGIPQLRGIINDVKGGKMKRATAVRKGLCLVESLSKEGLSEPEKDGITDVFLAALDKPLQPVPRSEESTSGSSKRKEPGDDGEEGDRDHRGDKKTKLRECDMPWHNAGEIQSLSASMKKTRQTLECINQDIKAAKRWLRNAPGAPSNFPPSEWEAILRGEVVDLEVVFQTLHFPRSDRTDYKPRSSYLIDERHIETPVDWTSAWNATMNATLFVFPHRGDELRGYESWMERWFRTKADDMTEHILLLDEAVRGRVRGGQCMSLLDEGRFKDIVDAVLHPWGIYYNEIQ